MVLRSWVDNFSSVVTFLIATCSFNFMIPLPNSFLARCLACGFAWSAATGAGQESAPPVAANPPAEPQRQPSDRSPDPAGRPGGGPGSERDGRRGGGGMPMMQNIKLV